MATNITFGKYKGKTIPSSSVAGTRPTTSMTRSVLLNMLMHNSEFGGVDFAEARIMDLCCGTGVVGLEFVSLGAKNIVFVDADMGAIKATEANIAYLKKIDEEELERNDECDNDEESNHEESDDEESDDEESNDADDNEDEGDFYGDEQEAGILDAKVIVRLSKAPLFLPANSFDLIFFDPPYLANSVIYEQIELIGKQKALSPLGILAIEVDTAFKVKPCETMTLKAERKVNSKTKLLFFCPNY